MDRPFIRQTAGKLIAAFAWQRLFCTVLAVCLVWTSGGCQIIIGTLMILKGKPLLDANFKEKTRKSMEGNDKKVAILCSSPEKAKNEFPGLDVELITEITRRMHAHKINVIDEHKVGSWIDDRGGEIDEAEIDDLGHEFNADYVVYIAIDEFRYKENNSPGLYRGVATGTVSVFEFKRDKDSSSKRPGKQIYVKPLQTEYPVNQPISAEQESASVFRKRFLGRVGEELARLFYDHRPGEDM